MFFFRLREYGGVDLIELISKRRWGIKLSFYENRKLNKYFNKKWFKFCIGLGECDNFVRR